ncbi:sigma-54 interaction domain-containing protein [Alteribacillus bidgolensis]|uniref:PAS domain S-box-containing protein n=1 Tax=Alteribacillus bidgolensis TaxID=930129 RepID=A0A1G8HHW6_9BACI|nr:sigma 54-interacting transcriptional regulator [Alteribacillus bidgolensis]SDI06253.1 PAS domain S-box-containing protein [Alteribacillus bidgolensis]
MRHQLPNVEDLIDTDVSFFSNINSLLSSIHKGYRDENHLYYYQKDGNYFKFVCREKNNIVLTEELVSCFSVSVPTVKKTESLKEMMLVLEEAEQAVVVGKSDQPIGVLDVKQAFLELYASYAHLNAYFEAMIDTMDTSISMIDEEERTVVWTSGAEQIFSIKKEDILGRQMTEFFKESMLKCRDSLYTGQAFQRYQHQPRPDLFVLINSQPIYLEGEIIGAVAAEVDVTSQVQLNRELYQANQKISDLENKMQKFHAEPDPFLMINGKSEELEKVKEKIKKISTTNATILIHGETGVGKELFAKAVHYIREDKNAPFIAINCGAISPTLFESELFGYEKGAFSGALNKGKAGKVALAKGGTLFLDEIGELPLDMQVKFLRVLQENSYFPVGGTKELEVDCRVVAATNKDLEKLVHEGNFREDLYYRLNTIPLTIPPLRERKDDIVDIAHLYLYELSNKYQRQIELVSPEAMKSLMEYSWPGNIRELKNVIEHIVVFSTSEVVHSSDLPERVRRVSSGTTKTIDSFKREKVLSLKEEMKIHERNVIRNVLEQESGNKNLAARTLGVSRATLYNKLNKHQLDNE